MIPLGDELVGAVFSSTPLSTGVLHVYKAVFYHGNWGKHIFSIGSHEVPAVTVYTAETTSLTS